MRKLFRAHVWERRSLYRACGSSSRYAPHLSLSHRRVSRSSRSGFFLSFVAESVLTSQPRVAVIYTDTGAHAMVLDAADTQDDDAEEGGDAKVQLPESVKCSCFSELELTPSCRLFCGYAGWVRRAVWVRREWSGCRGGPGRCSGHGVIERLDRARA